MRNISFSMTTEAYRMGWKTVSRRIGWWNLKPGEELMGCEKCQGLKKGEKIKRIHPLRVMRVETEPLSAIIEKPVRDTGIPEVTLEGFPSLTPLEFTQMFCKHNGCFLTTPVTRIEFEHMFDVPPIARLVA
jgi:hypothetical protein